MNIAGIGMISSWGLGILSFEKALHQGWREPAKVVDSRHAGQQRYAYQVDLDSIPDKTILKKIRRADKLSKMSVLAAADALADSGIEHIAQKKTGIILATAFGAHVTTFDFLDGILDFGDAAVSPTSFSNSVHNAAASYVSASLSIQGPTMTVTQFRFSFQSALQLAQTWLLQDRCDYVLVGGVDQYGDVLGYVAEQKLRLAKDGKIRPFVFYPTVQVPGEGAVFLLVTHEKTANVYCAINGIHINDSSDRSRTAQLAIIDADGMLPDESAYRSYLPSDKPVTAYAPLFGSIMTGSAFNIAAGALMLKKQVTYATPVQDNPFGIRLLAETGSTHIQSICCIGCNCNEEKALIYLNRL